MGLFYAEAFLRFLTGTAAFGFEKGRRDARDQRGGRLDAAPVVAPLGPGFPEEAALAVGRGQADHAAGRDGEHGPDGAVEVVGDAGGLVDDDQVAPEKPRIVSSLHGRQTMRLWLSRT